MHAQLADWLFRLPENVASWVQTLASDEHPGLFKACADSEIPYGFPSSSVCLGFMEKLEQGGTTATSLHQTAEFVLSCQQAETGLFIDPQLDPRFIDPSNAGAYRDFRAAITKYTMGLLAHFGVDARHPYSETGEGGKPDSEAYLESVKTRDWNRPWAAGSHAAGQTRELFLLVSDGHQEYIPAVREGLEVILSHQNSQTGM
ncbi:MAG: hypothetical protein QGH20_01870 [Candidatus Latescibacteria bacterium]|jgi:hypothetical protein|nr:hypothetical protein [Candidatus Latescibacterota bacterium]